MKPLKLKEPWATLIAQSDDYPIVARAYKIAVKVHEMQMYGSEPYINHPLRLAAQLSDPDEIAVALLHDVVEDSDITADDIIEKFGWTIGIPVKLLTREFQDDTHYFHYIEQCKNKPIAAKIKRLDLLDHLAHKPRRSLEKRYRKALEILGDVPQPGEDCIACIGECDCTGEEPLYQQE